MVTQNTQAQSQARTRSPRPSAQPNAAGRSGDMVPPSALSNGKDEGTMTAGTLSPEAAALIAEAPTTRKGGNIFTLAASNMSKNAAAKVEARKAIDSDLKQAVALYGQGENKAGLADELAGKAALRLYQARVNGLFSSDELTGILGDRFGFKKTPKGETSKTPNGQGEAIRKRVVRAVAAAEYVTNGDGGRFFEGLPEEKVSDIVARLDTGDIALFTAYNVFGDIKREAATRTNPAFDPKRISALVEALSETGAGEIVRNNPGLVAAYAALYDILMVIGEEPAKAKNAA